MIVTTPMITMVAQRGIPRQTDNTMALAYTPTPVPTGHDFRRRFYQTKGQATTDRLRVDD
jgi:hypothetical protein